MKIKHNKKLKQKLPIIKKIQPNSNFAGFPLKHISYSCLTTFSSNPILFKIKYLNGDVFDTTSNMSGVIGKAFHKGMEAYYGGTDEFVPQNEQEAIKIALEVAMNYINEYPEGWIEYMPSVPNKQKAIEMVCFGIKEYVKYSPYNIDEVLACEDMICETIEIEYNGQLLKMPIPLKGCLDITKDQNNKLKLYDYKTTQKFSDGEKIDGGKIIQAVEYYLLAYAKYGRAPYSMTFQELKLTKNRDGSPQVREYEMVFEENQLYFDFYFRFYTDVIRAINGEQVYVPNIYAFYDNEIAIVSYIQRLDIPEERAKLMKKHQVENITDILKQEIHMASNLNKLMKGLESKIQTFKNLNYSSMKNEEKIQTKLLEHGMLVEFDSKVEGCAVDVYRYRPSIGIKMSKIKQYSDDIEQVLGISGVRILAPIPNTSLIGFEVPRQERTFVELSRIDGTFNVQIGQTTDGTVRKFDIREAPHMLVAGSSGSGKSVFLNSIIKQLSKIPNASMRLFDPKGVELIEHAEDAEVYATSHEDILINLMELIDIMNMRYRKLKQLKKKNIEGTDFNYIFVVIDEFGDIMVGKERKLAEESILKLAQLARAAGIHLILTTQRPSTDIVSGTIKANFPVRVMFKTAKAVDSVVVLDEAGGEKLMGKGDMLFYGDKGIERLQGFNS